MQVEIRVRRVSRQRALRLADRPVDDPQVLLDHPHGRGVELPAAALERALEIRDLRGVALVGIHRGGRDRKSTRLNSSHGYISYAVFCLKKKKRKSWISWCRSFVGGGHSS